MKKKILYIALGLLIIINLTAFVTLTYHRCSGGQAECVQMEPHGVFLCNKLSLTESQIEEMEVIRKDFHYYADSVSSILNVKRSELMDLLADPNPDMDKINFQLNETNNLQASLQKYVIQYLLKKKDKLTPEQRKKFFVILKKRFHRQSKCNNSSNLNLINDNYKPNY